MIQALWPFFPQKGAWVKFTLLNSSHIWKLYLSNLSFLSFLKKIWMILFACCFNSFIPVFLLETLFSFFHLKVIFAFKLFIVTVNLKHVNCRCSEPHLWYSQKEVLVERYIWHRVIPSALVTNLNVACFRATRSQHSWCLASFIFLPLEEKPKK